jgi:hypothetical protein
MSRHLRHLAVICTLAAPLIVAACSAQSAAPVETAAQAAEPSGGGYEGFLEKMSCDMLRGWAWDRSQPDRALTIELYDGDTLLKTVVADQFRQDLLAAHKGNGRHLFIDAPPPTLMDGKPHTIRAVVKGAGYALRPLADTPPSMTCAK